MKQVLVILVYLNSIAAYAMDFTADTIEIPSRNLQETRQIIIFKPAGLQLAEPVSIIYLPDGEFAGYRYKKLADADLQHRYIGIGIINTNRNRDLLPVKDADRFLLFIQEELIPLIESGYQVEERILYGHSFAGAFTIYSMIQKPGLFDRYIASSPTPVMKLVDPVAYEKLDRDLHKVIRFYFSYGSRDMHQVKKWGERLFMALQGAILVHIDWKKEEYPGENHNSSDTISLLKGIRFEQHNW
jgi:predicted alpha/beta superfamily hydrolase